MKRIVQFHRFLSNMEISCLHNVQTAPTYFAELYESGAKDVLRSVREEYERLFQPFIDIQKK